MGFTPEVNAHLGINSHTADSTPQAFSPLRITSNVLRDGLTYDGRRPRLLTGTPALRGRGGARRAHHCHYPRHSDWGQARHGLSAKITRGSELV